tara:strand:- start:2133 stop:2762 length:630 start_codon:yes stop_codon:yes gene_type:complete
MAITASGAIDLNSIHVEAGGTSGTTCSMNDTDILDIGDFSFNTSRGLNAWYGKKAKWVITMTTGQTTVNTAGSDYVAANTERYRGYNGSSGTRPSGTTYGSMNDYQDADYLNNKTIVSLEVNGSSSATQPTTTVMFLQCADGCSNSDAAFKTIKVGGSTFARSAATYSDGSIESWSWTVGNQYVPNNTTGALTPMNSPGANTTVTFIGQ